MFITSFLVSFRQNCEPSCSFHRLNCLLLSFLLLLYAIKKKIIMDKLVILVIILFSFLCCSFPSQCFQFTLWYADCLIAVYADGIGINPSQTAGEMFLHTNRLLWTFTKTQFDSHPSLRKEFLKVNESVIKRRELNLCAVTLTAAMQSQHHQMGQAAFIIIAHKYWQHCVKNS